ncbi:OmpA family protein, partial [Sulfitobacter pseudonitzschiae]|nr:OmpA family protein [Pseudosulfitobacter pseudonitzschiae]
AADAEAEKEAEAKAAAEAATAADAEAEKEAEAKTAAEAATAADAEVEKEAEAKAAAEAATAADAEAEAKTAAEAATAADAESDAEAKAAAEAAVEAQPEMTEAEIEKEARREERRAKRQEERQAARKEAAANQEDAEAADVVEEVVTDENSRSSDEDFDTKANASAAIEEDSGGLSKFEKALLVGLGAVVVGKVLSNGDEVVSNSGDRVVVRRDGDLRVLKSDNELLRQPGSDVRTEQFNDGSTRTTVTRQDGSQVVTIASADGTVVERFLRRTDGSEITLIDDTRDVDPVSVSFLETRTDRTSRVTDATDVAALRSALSAQQGNTSGRTFSLSQVREIRAVRELVPTIELNSVTFDTGSAAIRASQAEQLADVGGAIVDAIEQDPSAIFLIEGHTDAVGDDGYNLALSDRRAESVALALTEYFDVPPENLITQGYGESALKIRTQTAERANRRAAVRNVTSLLR